MEPSRCSGYSKVLAIFLVIFLFEFVLFYWPGQRDRMKGGFFDLFFPSIHNLALYFFSYCIAPVIYSIYRIPYLYAKSSPRIGGDLPENRSIEVGLFIFCVCFICITIFYTVTSIQHYNNVLHILHISPVPQLSLVTVTGEMDRGSWVDQVLVLPYYILCPRFRYIYKFIVNTIISTKIEDKRHQETNYPDLQFTIHLFTFSSFPVAKKSKSIGTEVMYFPSPRTAFYRLPRQPRFLL